MPDLAGPDFAYVVVDDPIRALQRVAAAWRRELAAGVIGITGSVGKTSTKEAVAQVLRRRFAVHASRGNFNNEIGLPITILDATDEHERLVLEMGAYHEGEIASLCAIAEPQMGIVTTVGPTHLESFGSIEAIERGKGELVEALPETGLAVLNGDDERVRRMALRAACPVVTYGRGELCLVRATDVETRGLDGIAFTLRVPGGQARVESPLIGAHAVYPCLAAAAVGMADEMEPDEIAAALAEPPTRLRLKPLARPERRDDPRRLVQRRPDLDAGRARRPGRASRPPGRDPGRHARARRDRGGGPPPGRPPGRRRVPTCCTRSGHAAAGSARLLARLAWPRSTWPTSRPRSVTGPGKATLSWSRPRAGWRSSASSRGWSRSRRDPGPRSAAALLPGRPGLGAMADPPPARPQLRQADPPRGAGAPPRQGRHAGHGGWIFVLTGLVAIAALVRDPRVVVPMATALLLYAGFGALDDYANIRNRQGLGSRSRPSSSGSS